MRLPRNGHAAREWQCRPLAGTSAQYVTLDFNQGYAKRNARG
jgi:hypothetical protein